MKLFVDAPAKINLDLRILGRREDGFHELDTILQSIDLADTVSIRCRRGPFSVRSRSRGVPRDASNLIWQAAYRLWQRIGRQGEPRDVSIDLKKKIPIAAGFGGASSNVASALRGLSEVWAPDMSTEVLRNIGAFVGSDVPFFFRGGTVLATGRGECLRSLRSLKSFWLVLVVPPFGVSTPNAYRWWDCDSVKPATFQRSRGWRRDFSCLRNDLQHVVTQRYPELGMTIERLSQAGAIYAAMTGSGSAAFGLFHERSDALIARKSAKNPGWQTFINRTIGRDEFARRTAVIIRD